MRGLLIFLFSSIFLFAANDEINLESFDDEFAQEKVEVYDPLEPYNRVMTVFNDYVYLYVFEPAAKGYGNVMPEEARIAVANAFENLLFPVRFVNNLFQLKWENSADELFRFVINSTLGVAGLGDPAKEHFAIDAHDEDFGQTLGHYGVGQGFHLVLPFLGPSNLRDTFGLAVDNYADPISYVKTEWDAAGIKIYKRLNTVSLHVGEYQALKKDAIDFYPFLRDLYESRRMAQIKE